MATVLLCVAATACCVAMSMPQVHIVAYCTDLGYGAARGAEMLSLMLGFGIVSRVASGLLADRIGGMWTLLIGSAAQMTALLTNATYANIHSSTYPSGEVRGQVIKESGDFFVGSGNDAQEVPPTGSNGVASGLVGGTQVEFLARYQAEDHI